MHPEVELLDITSKHALTFCACADIYYLIKATSQTMLKNTS